MADITQAYRQAIVNYLRSNGAPTAISDIFLDIYDGDPQSGGTSVLASVTGSGTRPSVKSALGAATAATPSVSTNASSFSVTASAAAVNNISHIALFSAATAGTLIGSRALTSGTQTTVIGNPVSIPVSGLSISV